MSTLTVSIDRTSLALSPLVFSGVTDENGFGVVGYREPAIGRQVKYAPDSAYVHGSIPLASRLEQTVLTFDVVTDQAVSESASRTMLTELRAALGQWRFEVTVTINGVAEVWDCHSGSVGAVDRTFGDLKNYRAVWPVTVPAYPVRS